MTSDLLTIDAQTGEEIAASLTLREVPADTLAAAQRAAAALQNVIARKKKPVMFGGEQYLERRLRHAAGDNARSAHASRTESRWRRILRAW